MDEKHCPKCKQTLPADAFNKNKRRKSGLADYCKTCMKAVLSVYRNANQEKLRADARERANRRYQQDPETARAKQREWRQQNPSKVKTAKRKTYLKNRPSILAYAQKYGRTKRQHRRENYEQVIQKERQYNRTTYKNHTDHHIAKRHKFRARAAGVVGEFSAEQWRALVSFYSPDGKCLCCRQIKRLTVDHVIPVSKGGANTADNLQCICLSCNTKKKDECTDYRPDGGGFASTLVTQKENENAY